MWLSSSDLNIYVGVNVQSNQTAMNKVDKILDQFTDPLTGSVHGAVFIAIDSSGTVLLVIYYGLHLLDLPFVIHMTILTAY